MIMVYWPAWWPRVADCQGVSMRLGRVTGRIEHVLDVAEFQRKDLVATDLHLALHECHANVKPYKAHNGG